MDYSSYKHMLFERRGRILTITLDRPPMNPIHYELHNELSRLWYQVQVDHESDVIIESVGHFCTRINASVH